MSDQKTIVLHSPFDAHAHLREGDMARFVTPFHSSVFAGILPMPNTMEFGENGIIATNKERLEYEKFLYECVPFADRASFKLHPTIYLTSKTEPEDIRQGFLAGNTGPLKFYPMGATTNSDKGVVNIEDIYPVFEVAEELGVPICMHGEMSAKDDEDPWYSAQVFANTRFLPLMRKFPKMKVSLEHVSSDTECDIIQSREFPNLVGTVTPQHLGYDRRRLVRAGKFQPWWWCLPSIKGKQHRDAIQNVVFRGDDRFGLGTDSAPHPIGNKHNDDCCGGIFQPNALQTYAAIFEEHDALDKLHAFACEIMPRHYGLQLPKKIVTLERLDEGYYLPSPEEAYQGMVPMWAGKSDRQLIYWYVKSVETEAGKGTFYAPKPAEAQA